MAPQSSIMLASALALLSASAVMCDGGFLGLGGLGAKGAGESEGGLRFGKAGGSQEEFGKGGFEGLLGGLRGGADALGTGFGNFFSKPGFGIGFGGQEAAAAKKTAKGEAAAGELIEKKIAEKEAAKEGFLGIKGPGELVKVLLNPLELLGKIAAFFKLEKTGLVEAVGKGVTFGIEVALQPALLSIKIIEKVFVPDTCKLKFVCELGKPFQVLKGAVPKFSPGLLDGASSLKALTDGALGQDCEHLYSCGGELKLKKEFELLKNPLGNKLAEVKGGALNEAFHHHGGGGGGDDEHESEHYGGDHHFAASNQSPSTVRKDARPN